MKNLRCVLVLLTIATIATGLTVMQGCGSAVAPTDVADPISVNTLDGAEGVPVDGMFKFAFSRLMTPSTVTTSTFFMVRNEVSPSLNKATVDEDVCDPTQAIDATVECSSPIGCTLTPADMLEYSAVYSICLSGNMQYATGVPFEGFMATFTAEVEGPLSLNDLDGAVDVPVNSSFRYRFLKEVNASTVDTSTYFIVPTPAAASESVALSKAAIDPAICDSANAVASEVTCTRWSCTIAPSAYLEYITGYTVCLTSDVSYTSGSGFSGFMAGFTTGEWILSSIKLVRLDDTELELTDRPIPKMVSVKLTLSVAVADESERTAFESAVTLVDEGGVAAGGTFEWAADYLSVTFTPTHQLEYGTEYTINVDTSTFPPLSLSMALSAGDMSFTTMAEKDINGDGFADAIVGAEGYPGGDYKGRAYVYLGSASGIADCDLTPTSTCVPHATITGKSSGVGGMWANDWLGSSLSVIGDINADGFADIIVSAAGYNAGDWNGRAYIFLGSASGIADCDLSDPTCVPDAIITGETGGPGGLGDGLGESVSAAGDVNGDGYDDIIIGALYYHAYTTNKGRAYVFLGSAAGIGDCDLSDPACVPHATITGENNTDYLGMVSNAGDVNADGYDDVIVGAYGYPDGTEKGRAYVFLGSAAGIGDCDLSDPACVPHATITGENDTNFLGLSVSNAGDVNADGYADVIVGASGYSTEKGRAYVFLGSADGIDDCNLSDPVCVPHATITGEYTNGVDDGDWLGRIVSNAGDTNADGYDDVIVGAFAYPDGNRNGGAFVFLGSATGINDCDLTPPSTCVPDATITGESPGDQVSFVSTAGDINADGYADVIISAQGYNTGSWKGRAYIFMGSVSGISDCDLGGVCTADTTLTGESDGDTFGSFK